MITRSLWTLSLLGLFLVWPIQTQEAVTHLANLRVPEAIDTDAVEEYLDLLSARGVDLKDQGVRVESIDGSVIYADHLGDSVFNPASVIKIATSMAALERFGANHRFETAFYVDGDIDDQGVLQGDLILSSDGDPEMGTTDLNRIGRELTRAGLRRVEGQLIIDGPFTIGNLYSKNRVARHLSLTLRRLGIRVPTEVTYGPARGERMAERFSDPLRELVFYQNARSNNTMADRLGQALGGPRAVEYYLESVVGIPAAEVHVQRASGLRNNRITPTGTVMLLRKMTRWLEANNLYPEDILPVAGVDRGTLRVRFNSRSYRGAVVAKTGTLVSTDEGISTLAGVLYTKDHGPLLFAIFNTHGPVLQYRKFQDGFVKDLLAEYGGMPLANASSHRMGN